LQLQQQPESSSCSAGSSFANSRLIKIAALPKRAFELADMVARLERNLLLQKILKQQVQRLQ
jgi:hypothetical protein